MSPANERGPQPRQGRDPQSQTVGTDDAAQHSTRESARERRCGRDGSDLARRTTALLRRTSADSGFSWANTLHALECVLRHACGLDATHAAFVVQTADVLSHQYDGCAVTCAPDEPPPDLLDAILLADYWADRA